MRKNIFTLLFIALFCLLTGYTAKAQQPPTSGGYVEVDVDNKEIAYSVKVALDIKSKETKENYKLDTIYKAEMQVVAGKNYRVCLSVYVPVEGEANEYFNVQFVLYRNLKGEYKLTKWEEVEECE